MTGWQARKAAHGRDEHGGVLLAVIGAVVGTVFGIWRIVESTRGSIERSLQENDELDHRDRRRLRTMLK